MGLKNISVYIFLIFLIQPLLSLDIINTEAAQSGLDQRLNYKIALLDAALKETEEDFGSYVLNADSEPLSRDRALLELEKGTRINLYFAPTQPVWEERVIPIRIPIRKGLLNYRLLLTTGESEEQFSGISHVEDLKRIKVGLRSQWTTTLVLKALDFNVVEAKDYDSLFKMLSANRFDYIPRGVNEIFGEYDARVGMLENLVIEDTLALYLPMPVYMFVSPQNERLAIRIKSGLERMIENGRFDEIFGEYFHSYIEEAKLESRRILFLENPFLPEETPWERQELWYRP